MSLECLPDAGKVIVHAAVAFSPVHQFLVQGMKLKPNLVVQWKSGGQSETDWTAIARGVSVTSTTRKSNMYYSWLD